MKNNEKIIIKKGINNKINSNKGHYQNNKNNIEYLKNTLDYTINHVMDYNHFLFYLNKCNNISYIRGSSNSKTLTIGNNYYITRTDKLGENYSVENIKLAIKNNNYTRSIIGII